MCDIFNKFLSSVSGEYAPATITFLVKVQCVVTYKVGHDILPKFLCSVSCQIEKVRENARCKVTFVRESTICFVINMAVSYLTIDHRKWMFDISARLLYKGGYECFEEFFCH